MWTKWWYLDEIVELGFWFGIVWIVKVQIIFVSIISNKNFSFNLVVFKSQAAARNGKLCEI